MGRSTKSRRRRAASRGKTSKRRWKLDPRQIFITGLICGLLLGLILGLYLRSSSYSGDRVLRNMVNSATSYAMQLLDRKAERMSY